MQTQLHHPSNPDAETDRAETWTSGEWIGEGQGAGPRADTGTFHARQWVGEGQGSVGESTEHEEHWTSGEWIGEGQGAGPRADTGTFHVRQWVGAPRPPAAKHMPTTHR
jgi:hypothetical protein